MTVHYLTCRTRETRLNGERVIVVDTNLPDDAPKHLKEGLARRAIVNEGGTCPCGARAVPPNRAIRRRAAKAGRPLETTVEHGPGCPATLPGWTVDGGWSL